MKLNFNTAGYITTDTGLMNIMYDRVQLAILNSFEDTWKLSGITLSNLKGMLSVVDL